MSNLTETQTINKLKSVIDELKSLREQFKDQTRNPEAALEKLLDLVEQQIGNLTEIEQNLPLSGDIQQDIMPLWDLFPNPQFGLMNFSVNKDKSQVKQEAHLQLLTDVVCTLADKLDKKALSNTEKRLIERLERFEQEG